MPVGMAMAMGKAAMAMGTPENGPRYAFWSASGTEFNTVAIKWLQWERRKDVRW